MSNVEATAPQAVAPQVVTPPVYAPEQVTAGFNTAEGFALLQRMAQMFSHSSLVPEQYQQKVDKDGNVDYTGVSNCIIALNMAQRMKADPLMVIQNLYIVYNQPAWSSKFMIATFNQCGRFSSIRYKETGKKGTDSQGIIAYATEIATGDVLEGPEVTIAVAKAEGWYDKKGSKWRTMPDQMLRYRAAAWFIRTTAPELSMGLQTVDEVRDVNGDREAQSTYERKAADVPKPEIIDAEVAAPKLEPKRPPKPKQDEEVPLFPEDEGVLPNQG